MSNRKAANAPSPAVVGGVVSEEGWQELRNSAHEIVAQEVD
jgi:hypothetical protein